MESKFTSTSLFPQLHYLKAGTGAPIMLIHGFPESGKLWKQVGEKLSENYTVLIPDIPGSGQSKLVGENINMGEMAQAMHAVLINEKIEKAIVAGHSMGGYVALAFAAQFPEMMAGLALVHSTAFADDDAKKEKRKKSIALIRKGGRDAFVKGMIPNLFSPASKKQHPEWIEQQIERGKELNAGAMIAYYDAMIDRRDRTNVLKEADYPVLFIAGNDDNVIPLEAIQKQKTLPKDAQLEILSDCGHLSMIEQPEALLNALKNFAESCRFN